MKQIVLCLFTSLAYFFTQAQTATVCEVSLDSLKGTYEGECSSGKASGQGKAVGTHTYEGTFKKGYPDGTGKYTWPNGDYYTGNWKKGVMDGKGELHNSLAGRETIKIGFWKKGVYKGEHETPFVIHNKTTDVGRVQATNMKKEAKITIQVENLASQGAFGTTNQASITKLTDIILRSGNFTYRTSNILSNKEVTLLQDVSFPFRATFVFGPSSVDIELFEQGTWEVVVPINK